MHIIEGTKSAIFNQNIFIYFFKSIPFFHHPVVTYLTARRRAAAKRKKLKNLGKSKSTDTEEEAEEEEDDGEGECADDDISGLSLYFLCLSVCRQLSVLFILGSILQDVFDSI